MNEKERKAWATKVAYLIPKEKKIVPYLMDTLKLSKESVYRRLRGEVSFSLEEIAALAGELGFSIDELVESPTDCPSFRLSGQLFPNSTETFEYLLDCLGRIFSFAQNEEGECACLASLNTIHPLFHKPNHALLRFLYFDWMQQNGIFSPTYADVAVPRELFSLSSRSSWDKLLQYPFTVIVNPDVFLNLSRRLRYYYQIGFIDAEGLSELQEAFEEILSHLEQITTNGCTKGDKRFHLLLSELPVQQNVVYVKSGRRACSYCWLNDYNMVFSRNAALCKFHGQYLTHLHIHSTYISHSNQMLQKRFFAKQRQYLAAIREPQASQNFQNASA
jgi:hypothetical protein